jgi:hypothetical protein
VFAAGLIRFSAHEKGYFQVLFKIFFGKNIQIIWEVVGFGHVFAL